MGSHDAAKTSAGIRKTARRARQLTPDSKALGGVSKSYLSKKTETSCPVLIKFWTRYVKCTTPLINLQITPIENVGYSNNPANSTPNTRGWIHQVKTMTNPASKALGDRRNSHQK